MNSESGLCELQCASGEQVDPFDENNCREIFSCPGDETETAQGACELRCDADAGYGPDPFRENECRLAFSCRGDETEIADRQCALMCGPGEEPNPFDASDCRTAFSCPKGMVEESDRRCAESCPDGTALQAGGFCAGVRAHPIAGFAPTLVVLVTGNAAGWSPPQNELFISVRLTVGPTVISWENHELVRTLTVVPTSRTQRIISLATVMIVGESAGSFRVTATSAVVLRADSDECPPHPRFFTDGENVAFPCVHVAAGGREYSHQVNPGANYSAEEMLRVTEYRTVAAPPKAAATVTIAITVTAQGRGDGAVLGRGTRTLLARDGQTMTVQKIVTLDSVRTGLEYWRSFGLAYMRISAAYQFGLSGRGVTLGMIEPDPLHWSADNGSPTTHFDLPGIRLDGARGTLLAEESVERAAHGIAVAGILAAKRDGVGVHGVAPEAELLYGNFLDAGIVSGEAVGRGHVASVVASMADKASFVNNSWGIGFLQVTHYAAHDGGGELDLPATRANLSAFIADNAPGLLDALRQEDKDDADKAVFVWAAGNERGWVYPGDGRAPGVAAGLPYYFPELKVNNLAVVSSPYLVRDDDEDGGRQPVESNWCGKSGADFCLAAYGGERFASERNINYRRPFNSRLDYLPEGLCSGIDDRTALNECKMRMERIALYGAALKNYLLGAGPPERCGTDDYSRGTCEPTREQASDWSPEFSESEYDRYVPDGDWPQNFGTSFSAPMVTGALALLKEYFDRMGGIGNDELVQRLIRTAYRGGAYENAERYGAGLMDLPAALAPYGELTARMGGTMGESRAYSLSGSALRPGRALGDAAARALEGVVVAAFDDLHAPFPISSEMVLRESSRARLGGLGSHLRRWQVGDAGSGAFSFSDFRDGSAWWSLNAPGDSHFDWDERVGSGGGNASAVFSDWVGNPYSGLAGRGLVAGSSFRLSGGNDVRMAMFGESLGNEKRFRGVLAEFSFSPFSDGSGEGEGSRWFAQAGGIRESDGLLASSGSGLFSDLNSRTAFAGLGFAGGFSDGWRYRLGAHWGRTSAEGGAWLTATDSLRSGSYAAGLERANVFRSGDGLGFRIRQPLRVSGGLKFRVPTGRTKYGELTWSEVSGTPSGRELEWEARYRGGDESGRWGVSAVLVSESGHRSGAKTEGRALFAFERAF